jgi:sec-independent protein translocase protein TatA
MLSSVLLFLDIGGPEVILIMFVALLLFGGDKLPELARGLGKGIRDFKDASEGVKREITNQIDNFESKKEEKTAETTDETPLIEEHAVDNPEGTAEESYVAHTIPINETYVTGTDQFELEKHHTTENHTTDNHTTVDGSTTNDTSKK